MPRRGGGAGGGETEAGVRVSVKEGGVDGSPGRWTLAATSEKLPLGATNGSSVPWQSETCCLPGCGCPQLPKPLAGRGRAHHTMKGPPCLYLPRPSQPRPLPACCTVSCLSRADRAPVSCRVPPPGGCPPPRCSHHPSGTQPAGVTH